MTHDLPGVSTSLSVRWGRAEPLLWLFSPSLSFRYDEGSGGSGDEGRDEAHKREWNLFYQKQMSLRKVKGAEALMGARGLYLVTVVMRKHQV